MKTVIDQFHARFLRAAVYAEGTFRVIIAEGFRAAEPEEISIGGQILSGTYAINTSDKGRLAEICFNRPIAWQLVDESFTASDDYDVPDDKSALRVLAQSRYLDYIRAHHGWFEDLRGAGKHYCVVTEDAVLDVVACEPPSVGLTAMEHRTGQ